MRKDIFWTRICVSARLQKKRVGKVINILYRIVTVIYASAIWTVLNGLGHTFDGRVKSKDVDGPLGVSVFNADLRIFEVDFFSVKRTMIFGFAAVQATKSGALRSTLRFKQIGVAKRRHGFTGFTGEPEK